MSPIDFTPSPIVTSDKDVQSKKAHLPIDSTLPGILISVTASDIKAYAPIDFTPLEITIDVIESP